MRQVALPVLAIFAALTAVSCGGDGSAPESALRSGGASVLAYDWQGKPVLVRVDAVTLETRSRGLDLGQPPISTWVRSPEGDRLALGSGDGARLMFADLKPMGWISRRDLGPRGYVAALAWPRPRRVVAALSGTHVEVLVADPETGRVLSQHRLPGLVTRAARPPAGLVLLVSPNDRIGRATLVVATPAGVRAATLPLETGVSPPAVAEPGLAVSPDGRRALVVPGDARVLEVDLRTLAVVERELSEPVSLLGRLRSWLEPAALAKGPLEGPVRSAVWVSGDRVLVAGSNYRPNGDRGMVSEAAGVRLIDTRTWTVRTLAEEASAGLVAGDMLLAFGGTQGPVGLRGVGLRGFGLDGGERFHLFEDRFVAVVAAVGQYAYVSEQSESETRVDVVDITSGRVVRTARKQTYFDVLQLD
jgi:DNA-binding beta-propeller fold protein YncE